MPTTRDNAIEQGRLTRALDIAWDKIGPRQYIVAGNDQPFYYVDLDSDVPCQCDDVKYYGLMCKHRIRCLIVERDPSVFDQVLRLYERQAAQQREDATAAKRSARRSARPTRARRTRAVATEATP